MWRPNTTRGRLLCAFALALLICRGAPAAEQERIVLLRSGGVLHGTVTVNDERYVVTRPNSVVDVPAAQVLLVADSMEDAYQRQRGQLSSDTTEAHLALAEWCLRYGLLKSAEQEIADARRLDSRDPRVALLERRLVVAAKPKKSPPTTVAPAAHDDTASADELRELESFVNELPSGVVERFTRKVQPLLVNSCTTSGCHQAGGKQDFQLDRAVLHGLTNRRITLRNLVSALELVNRDVPQKSDLLAISRRTHGGMERPIFGPRQQAQLAQLFDWVGLVTETSTIAEPIAEVPAAEAAPIASFGLQAVQRKQPRFVDRNVVPAGFDETAASLLPSGELKFGADLRPWQPKDEFDPEIFNRTRETPTDANAPATVGPSAAY